MENLRQIRENLFFPINLWHISLPNKSINFVSLPIHYPLTVNSKLFVELCLRATSRNKIINNSQVHTIIGITWKMFEKHLK